jgi:hypothetical protein
MGLGAGILKVPILRPPAVHGDFIMETKRPLSITTALVLILVESLIWMVLGIVIALGRHPALPDNATLQGIMAALAIACSIAMVVLVLLLAHGNRIAYYLAATLLGVILILTVTDDFGFADLAVLVFTIAPLILLVSGRRWFYPSAQV